MSTPNNAPSFLDFFCQHCGHDLHVPPHLAGSRTDCPACRTSNTVPTPDALSPAAVVAPVNKVIKFFCLFCGQKLSTPEAMAGVRFDCPSCMKSIAVPGEKAAPVSSEPLLKFFCTSCGQKLAVETKFAGRRVDCPVCAHANQAPGHTPPAPPIMARSEPVRTPVPPRKLERPAELARPAPAAAPSLPAPGPVSEPAPITERKPVAPRKIVPPVMPEIDFRTPEPALGFPAAPLPSAEEEPASMITNGEASTSASLGNAAKPAAGKNAKPTPKRKTATKASKNTPPKKKADPTRAKAASNPQPAPLRDLKEAGASTVELTELASGLRKSTLPAPKAAARPKGDSDPIRLLQPGRIPAPRRSSDTAEPPLKIRVSSLLSQPGQPSGEGDPFEQGLD